MKFISQFKSVINNEQVREKILFFLEHGKKDPLFINYFGVNYDTHNILTVKLYFSYFNFPEPSFFAALNIPSEYEKLIREKWKTSKQYNFLHQGLTFSLKCHFANNEIIINNYFHFRSEYFKQKPKLSNLVEEKNNINGISVEFGKDILDERYYYYLTSEANKATLFKKFELYDNMSKINLIEYTESKDEQKVNVLYKNSNDVFQILLNSKNEEIITLSSYLFNKFNLYFFAPGARKKSDKKAIYFVSKESYYGLSQESSINKILSI